MIDFIGFGKSSKLSPEELNQMAAKLEKQVEDSPAFNDDLKKVYRDMREKLNKELHVNIKGAKMMLKKETAVADIAYMLIGIGMMQEVIAKECNDVEGLKQIMQSFLVLGFAVPFCIAMEEMAADESDKPPVDWN